MEVRARRGTIALSHQIIDFALQGPHGSPTTRRESETLWSLIGGLFNRWGQYAHAITRWEHITGRPAPAFVEWLMGLPTAWVTDTDELTQNHQITALGHGVLPLQACSAFRSVRSGFLH